tara:strand:+ start:822 stop:1058 length:237 start_codon:yes stop_codon:yes gene_type:complete
MQRNLFSDHKKQALDDTAWQDRMIQSNIIVDGNNLRIIGNDKKRKQAATYNYDMEIEQQRQQFFDRVRTFPTLCMRDA